MHLVSLEDSLPSRAPQAPASDFGLRRGEPLGGAHGVLPTAAPAIGRLETALNNLTLAVTNDTAVLQKLILANLALTAIINTLTATNKKLADAVAHAKETPAAGTPLVTPGGGVRSPKIPCPGNYCWMHGHRISKEHTSATCANKATGHRNNATGANTFGGSKNDKEWYTART